MAIKAIHILEGLHKTNRPHDALQYKNKPELVVVLVREVLAQCQEMGYSFKRVSAKKEDTVIVLLNKQYYGQVTDHSIQFFIRTACETVFKDVLPEAMFWGLTISSRSLVKQFKCMIEYSDYVSIIK